MKNVKKIFSLFLLLMLLSCSANELIMEQCDQVVKDRNLELRENLRHRDRNNFSVKRPGRESGAKHEKLEKMTGIIDWW